MSPIAHSVCRLATAITLALQIQQVASVPFSGQTRQVSNPTVNGYTYEGCYVEPNNGRALEIIQADDLMTLEMCAEICSASSKKTYFGVEYGRECWCGSTLASGATAAADDAECSFTCPGNSAQHCGAGSRLSLYKNDNVAAAAPVTSAKPAVGNRVHQGCYSDLVQGQRALSSTSAGDAMTPESCAAFCGRHTYMALEYGRECWCGNELDGNSQRVADQIDCNMPCAGDSTSLCGGPSRINLYKLDQAAVASTTSSAAASAATDRVGDWLSQGCWTDESADGRTLSMIYAADDMTIAKCAAWAASSGFLLFGIEYSRECWGGLELNPKSVAADPEGCSMRCSGNANEVCGGPNRLSLYSHSPAAPSSTSSPDIVTSTSISAASLPASATDSSSSQTASAPVTEDAPPGPSSVPLNEASVENAQVEQIDSQTAIVMSPPTGGEAKVGLPVTAPADAQPGDQIQVQLTYKTEAVSVLKRAELTQCTLTMYLGPTLIYQNKIWTTDGSYTTVTSMPAGPSSVTTLVIVQFCPTTSVPIVIRDVSVSVVAASSASSNAAQSTTNISTGTAVPVDPAPVATPTGGTSSSAVPMPTSVPSTTAAPEPPSTPSSQVPLYRAQAYTTGACSRSGSGNCVLSGAPVATSGLLAAATPVPVLNPGNPTQAYELCARMCQNTIGCNSWALDRTLSDNAPEWKCYFYSGVVSSYAVSPNRAYNDIVWFSKDCYGCMQQAQVLYVADQAAVLSSSSSSSSSTPSDAAAVVPTTRAPEPAASSTKSVRPGITPPPDVPTLEMPTTVTETSCPLPTVGQWYTAGCTLSGAPLQTSGLVAIATGIPATPSGAVTNAPFEHAYQACAQMCAAMTTCRSWALDRGMWPSDYSDWTCYFYSAGARVMAPQNQGNSWVVWMDSMCYNCGTPTPSPALPSSTSSNAPPPPSAATATPTTTPVIPATSAPAPTTTSPPQEPSAFAAPTYTSGVCATKSNPANQAPCAISGWPTPASLSGLVAVATGVPPNPSGSFNFEQPFQVCARACAAVDGCTVWAVDRGNWPTDMSTWSCLLYNFNGRNYLLNTSPNAASSRYAWSDSNCYNCTLSQQAVSNYASSSSSSPTSSTVPVSPLYASSSGPLTTTSAPAAAITTFSAPPLVTSCNRPTAAQWYTNGCTMSGVATATTSLLAVATGIAPNAAGDFNFEPAYQRCASICAGIAGCQGYALDRTNTTSWNCNFHDMAIQPYLSRQQFTVDNRGVVWMSMLCYDCPVPGPWPPVAPSSSSVAAAVSTTLLPSETAAAALPSVTPTTSTSTSTAFSIQGYSQTTFPASASTSASAIPSTCTRAASPPASAACDVKGFRQPAGQAAETHVYTQADCAAYCLTTGAAVCKSYAWIPATGWCGVYSLDVWTAIGDDAVAGRAYRDYVLDEPGCFACPEGVAVKYLPS